MKTNNMENQSTVATLLKSNQQEKYQPIPLRTHKGVPKLVVPTEQTPKLICRYFSESTIENLNLLKPEIWRDSLEVKFSANASNGTEEGLSTFVRFAWTDKALLFYVEVEQPEKEAFLNNDKVWTGNNIEFLISPRWYDQPLYDEYEFLFNSQQAYNDLYWIKGCNLTEALNKYSSEIQWQTKSDLYFHKELQGWSMMGKIPFSDFQVFSPLEGSYWGLGLFRKTHRSNGSILLQAWSPPLNNPPKFHTPSRFGMLMFTKENGCF
jgi:hypothetical protein